MKGNRVNRKRYRARRNKKSVIILVVTFFIVCAVGLAVKFIPKKDKLNVQVGTNQEQDKNNGQLSESKDNENKNDFEDKEVANNEESNTLDNSNYLELKDDPNADDASMVAENTKGLLNGTKTYPVRTDGKKVVYLTFDDGPSTTNTPAVLDVLNQYNVKGTFFVLGNSLEGNEEAQSVLKDIAKEGHAIANHTYGHNYSYLYPNRVMNVDNIVSDIEKNNNLMKEILGKDFSTRVIRFPGGYWSWEGRTAMKDKMIETGYCNIDWNALNKDAEGNAKNADQLLQSTKETVEALGPNADSVVLLMHDTYGKEETVKALPQIIEYLQSNGYEFRTIK